MIQAGEREVGFFSSTCLPNYAAPSKGNLPASAHGGNAYNESQHRQTRNAPDQSNKMCFAKGFINPLSVQWKCVGLGES